MSTQPPTHPGDEVQVAAAMSTELERLVVEPGIRALEGFADRVMAAVALEPLPQPARAFRVALLGGRLSAAIASIGDAWRVVVGGSTPLGVRAQSLALVLVLAIGSAAIASGAAVGAMGLLTPGPTTPLPSETMPSASPSPSLSPSPSPSASPSASPDAQVGASPSAEPTDTPGSTQRPRTPSPTATGTDDLGGSGSGSGGSGGDSGSGGGDHTPTPSPTETDDPSGSSDG